MNFCIGDKVKFLNETGEGIVTAIKPDKITVEIEGWIQKDFLRKELILLAHKNNEKAEVSQPQTEFQEVKKKPKRNNTYLIQQHLKQEILKGRKRGNVFAEIDLHFENLSDYPNHIDNAKKLPIQLDYFKQCLNGAFELKIQKIIVIHGIGEGILKKAIYDYVKGFEEIEIQDASYKEYGKGATEIIIKGLHKK